MAIEGPPRVAFFSWTAALGKILTIDNLRKRHLVVLEWCFMCKRCGEFVDHLLLHCHIAFEMWSMIFCLFGVCWVMPQRVVDLLDCWSCNFRRHRNIVIWRFVPHCLMWCIWWEWNSRSFEGCERSFLEFKSFFFFTLLEWCFVLPFFFLVSLFLCWLIIVLWFLDVFSFFVHSLCTGRSFNEVFMLLIKKKLFN